MTVIVFSGATLPHSEARKILDADYRPPAAQGDLYRAARERPAAIALIDGYFEHVPAVWHKEILWALSQGVWVFGAASMGALRAAELARYGMIGVGSIFESFASGLLEDDDEVAVAELASPQGPVAASVALVDIRATLAAACAAQVITDADGARLLEIAKDTFYPERSYERLLDDASRRGVSPVTLTTMRVWLRDGRVAQKRIDALALLERVGAGRDHVRPFQARFHFEHTDMWHQLECAFRCLDHTGEARARASCSGSSSSSQESKYWGRSRVPLVDETSIVDEARITDPAMTREIAVQALLRALASEIARFEGASEPAERVEAMALRFRRAQGLSSEGGLRDWLAERDLSPEGFIDMMIDDARLERLRTLLAGEMSEQLSRELRRTRSWPRLALRARQKASTLAECGLEEPDPKDRRLPLTEAESAVSSPDPYTEGQDSSARSRLLLREAWFRRLRQGGTD